MPLAKPGDTLHDNNGNTYIIEKFLGEGVTAEVFKATQQDGTLAALKILRPGLPREIIQSFRDEALVLGQLRQHSQRRYPKQPLHIPKVLGRTDENTNPEFLALEYIDGEPLDDLIDNTGGLAAAYQEKDALLIAQQVLKVLSNLHEDVCRSYTDFQLKNIWWLAEEKQVKVMDWNHVSRPSKEGDVPDGASGDLIRFGAFFYQLLTGKGALQTGETKGALAQRAEDSWQDISLSTRAVIVKSLHPNPALRYQTAQAFLAEIERVLGVWQQDLEELYDVAAGEVRQIKRWDAQEDDSRTADTYAKAVTSASCALDMYTRRSSDTKLVERLQQELDALTQNISSQWGAGRKYYEAGIYSQASRLWEEEARSLERLDLWRWVQLAQIGKEMGKQYVNAKEALESSVLALEDKNLNIDTAMKYVQEAQRQGVVSDHLTAIKVEIQARQFFKNAGQTEDLQAAGDAYQRTAQALAQIQEETYLQFLTTEAGGQENYTTLPSRDVILGLAEECYSKQEFSAGEGERIEIFRQKLVQAQANAISVIIVPDPEDISERRLRTDDLDELASWLKEQFLLEKNQPALLQTVVDETEALAPTDAVALLSVIAIWGKTMLAVQTALQAQRAKVIEQETFTEETQYQRELKEAADKKRMRLRAQEAAILMTVRNNEFNDVLSYIDQVKKADDTVSDTIVSAVEAQFDKSTVTGQTNEFYDARKWLAILDLLLSEEAYGVCHAQLSSAVQKQFDAALKNADAEGVSVQTRQASIDEAHKWLSVLETLLLPNEFAMQKTLVQQKENRQTQFELEQHVRFKLQEAKALIGDGNLYDARPRCGEVRSAAQKLQDSTKRKQYLDEANQLTKKIKKLEVGVQKNLTVEAYLTHLPTEKLQQMGEDIKMKLENLGNIDKKMNRGFGIILLLNVVAIIVVGALLYFLFNGISQDTRSQINNLETQISDIVVDTNSVITGVSDIQATMMAVPPTVPAPTVTDLSSLESQIAELNQKFEPLLGLQSTPEATPEPILEPTPTLDTTSSLQENRINTRIEPYVQVAPENSVFELVDLDNWLDTPNYKLVILEDGFSFQVNNEETGYAVVDDKTREILGDLIVQIRQNSNIIGEYFYPVVEGALSDDLPTQLNITWQNTEFPLLPPGNYEVLFITQRQLEMEPSAFLGEPQDVIIADDALSAHTTSPERLRIAPIWDCTSWCVTSADAANLPVAIKILGFVNQPFAAANTTSALTYEFPPEDTPVLSFLSPLTITKQGIEETLPPDTEISPETITTFSDNTTLNVTRHDDAKFFIVQIPGTRLRYWLGESDLIEFYYPETREKLLSLPEFTKIVEGEG